MQGTRRSALACDWSGNCMSENSPISTSRRHAVRLRRYAHIETYILHLPCQLSTSSRRVRGREPKQISCVCLRCNTNRGELSVAAKAGRLELVQVGYLIQRKGVVVGHWEEEPETAAHQRHSIALPRLLFSIRWSGSRFTPRQERHRQRLR